jgi:hypothetical protein
LYIALAIYVAAAAAATAASADRRWQKHFIKK